MYGAARGGTKMDALKDAVNLFADLLIPGQGDEIGAIEFDDIANILTQFGAFDIAKQNTLKSNVNNLTPRNNTSIGGGLRLGQLQLGSANTQRKVILVFTDGLENTPPTIADVTQVIRATNTEIYAIGLGQPQNISS
jgi:nitric oxide reductase activation protein